MKKNDKKVNRKKQDIFIAPEEVFEKSYEDLIKYIKKALKPNVCFFHHTFIPLNNGKPLKPKLYTSFYGTTIFEDERLEAFAIAGDACYNVGSFTIHKIPTGYFVENNVFFADGYYRCYYKIPQKQKKYLELFRIL